MLQTRATPIGIEIICGDENEFTLSKDFFGAIYQYTGKHGGISNLTQLIEIANALEIKVAVCADLLSLTLLEAPGHYGADVVVGTTQRFGIPMGYGRATRCLFCN